MSVVMRLRCLGQRPLAVGGERDAGRCRPVPDDLDDDSLVEEPLAAAERDQVQGEPMEVDEGEAA
jgi:hypothetical protein